MQNWEAMQPTANYEQHNTWYNNMFAANIKAEPGTASPSQHFNGSPSGTQLENYLKQHHQHATMDTLTAMTPSPSNNDSLPHFFDGNMQHQLLQQQQYQQQFQQAQQAAAQNQITSAHLPLGFNPLTPPGLPTAVLPSMSHFYNPTNLRPGQQTPSPQPSAAMDSSEKLQAALTPRNTPPMDVTPPKSPKTCELPPQGLPEKEQDLHSNSSEDMKYAGESEDDESIRMPIYNSHGKMKNYKCKSCGLVAITKIAFWEHVRSHMKPEKILQCPKCPFVTELKHHLEYHIRKHKNLKPFQCDKCSYTCVNKSMLNSHRKSHSSVYQYRCADCDYATKYCHSFKLHLRKYDHKPGMVLDEEGIPNPSVVIDVYGTRRGPKTKGAGVGSTKRSSERHNGELKLSTSQLSAALQGFHQHQQQQQHQQHQLPASPAKSTSSTTSEMTLNMSHREQQQIQQKPVLTLKPQLTNAPPPTTHTSMSNLLPPLASILQQNRNMAFLPYWNLNLHMLAAQQQAVLAQLSPSMRETALQQLQSSHQNGDKEQPDEEDEDADDFETKSIDSAMDLSQGTPTKSEEPRRQTPEVAINLKLEESNDTPLHSSSSASRRKGRVLKLDTLLQQQQQQQTQQQHQKLPVSSPSPSVVEPPPASSPIVINNPNNTRHVLNSSEPIKLEDNSSEEEDESMETAALPSSTVAASSPTNAHAANTSSSSSASSSGNSSNGSSTSSTSSSPPAGAIYECKYCDIYFKDAVLYTIHMGYHSCDDAFKCNMCGEKCETPVGLFVHMARNAHS